MYSLSVDDYLYVIFSQKKIPSSFSHAFIIRMIAAANSNLSNLTSAAACLEFITAKKGLEYLTGIVEIYRVGCRIFTSMKVNVDYEEAAVLILLLLG